VPYDKYEHLPRLLPSKLSARVRTREARAQKIESLLPPLDENIEKYYQKKQDRKPVVTFEYRLNQMMKRANQR
jgi:hypothetical protein